MSSSLEHMIHNRRNNWTDYCYIEIERAIYFLQKPCVPVWLADEGIDFRTEQVSLLNDPVLTRIKKLQDYQWFPLTQEGHFDHDVYDISEAIKKIDATVDENYQAIPVVSINHGSVLPSAPLPQHGARHRPRRCIRNTSHVTCRVDFDTVTDHVMYAMEIYIDDGNGNIRSGVLRKRYSDLFAMHQLLKTTRHRLKIPHFPKKTFLKCTDVDALNIRAGDLTYYCQGLLNAGLQNEPHLLNLIAHMAPLVLNRDRFLHAAVRVEECRKAQQRGEGPEEGNYLEYKFEIDCRSGIYWIRFSDFRALHLRLCSVSSRHQSRCLKRKFPWRTLFRYTNIHFVAKRMRDLRNYMNHVTTTHQRLVMEFLDEQN